MMGNQSLPEIQHAREGEKKGIKERSKYVARIYQCSFAHTFACMHARACTHSRTRMHVCMHTRARMHMHTHKTPTNQPKMFLTILI